MTTKEKEDKKQIDYGGIEYLNKVDHLFIKQHLEILEILTHCQTPNKYAIRNNEHKTVYYAIEKSRCCARFCLGARRALELVLINTTTRKKLCRMVRSIRCACCSCCTHSQEMWVYLPDDAAILGYVRHEDRHLGKNVLSINNAAGGNILMIKGPKMKRCFSRLDYVFSLYHKDIANISLGSIKKHWAGWGQELLTSADNLSIVFPLNAEVNTKLLIIAAAFLIDLVFFE